MRISERLPIGDGDGCVGGAELGGDCPVCGVRSVEQPQMMTRDETCKPTRQTPGEVMDISLKAKTYACQIIEIAEILGVNVEGGAKVADIGKEVISKARQLTDMTDAEVWRYHRELKRMLGTTKNLHDALKAKLDSMPNMTKERDAWQKKAWKWEEKCLERDSRIDALLDLIRDAAEEYKDKHYWAQVWHDRAEDMRMERDELQAKLDEYDRTHVELPKGLDGEHIHMSDVVRFDDCGEPFEVREIRYLAWDEPYVSDGEEYGSMAASCCQHVETEPTDTAESIVNDLKLGMITAADAIDRIERLRECQR